MRTAYVIGGGVVAGVLVILLLNNRRPSIVDSRIDPQEDLHRQIPAIYAGTDQVSTRNPSRQDPLGGMADFGGYPFRGSMPSSFAKGEPAQVKGDHWDKGEDRWGFVPPSPIDYGRPPLRIPRLWRDHTRYWDGLTSYGGTEVVGQRVHLFHFRPSPPTRGNRSISGSLASIGGGQSTASRIRIPSIFVPSNLT